jgi:acyl carrier protein
MGLDSVEILLQVEQACGVKIPDKEAEQILTVGDFQAAVWKQVSGRQSNQCVSQHLFYKIRQSFAEKFGIEKKSFTLDAIPDHLFPVLNRRKVYYNFGNTIDLELPDLILTKSWSQVLSAFGLITIIGSLVLSLILINIFDYSWWTLLFPVAGIVTTLQFSGLLNPKRIIVKAFTMRQFTQQILILNYSKIAAVRGVNRKEIDFLVTQIIADMSGHEPDEVTADKKLGDDLGID